MKGLVFKEFFDFVDTRYGPAATEAVLDRADLGHDGVYAATGAYPFEDLGALVGAACAQTGETAEALLRDFGGAVGCSFARGYRAHFEPYNGLFEMLENVDGIIHVEVRKLYPEAELPRFFVERRSAEELVLLYCSERRLWDFAKGIIEAAAGYYGESVRVRVEPRETEADAARITVSKRA